MDGMPAEAPPAVPAEKPAVELASVQFVKECDLLIASKAWDMCAALEARIHALEQRVASAL